MHRTFGSLFSGGGGADIGAKAAGLKLAWANEYDPAIADVYTANLGNHIVVGDMLDLNPFDFEWVNHLHISPPCTRASTANQSAEINEDGLKESPLDIALANKCIQFIEALRPESVTLKNVWAYRKFQSWKGGKKCEGIQSALYRLGYWLSMEHVNFADMGVPQTRRRMIVRAVRDAFVPYLPQPVRWVGWYEAIEDILHTLPDSQFADWQMARLPDDLKTMLVAQGGYDGKIVVAGADEPAFSLTANGNQTKLRAVLVDSKNVNQEYGKLYRTGDEPALTVTTDGRPSHMPKAFLVGKTADKYGDGLRWFSVPAQTIGANEHGSRAFIIDGKNSGNFDNGPTVLNGKDPIFAIQASQAKGMPRTYDGVGRVVAMTPRALARFQSFPDDYTLPDSKTLAAKIIGNAVPPLGYEKIIGGLL